MELSDFKSSSNCTCFHRQSQRMTPSTTTSKPKSDSPPLVDVSSARATPPNKHSSLMQTAALSAYHTSEPQRSPFKSCSLLNETENRLDMQNDRYEFVDKTKKASYLTGSARCTLVTASAVLAAHRTNLTTTITSVTSRTRFGKATSRYVIQTPYAADRQRPSPLIFLVPTRSMNVPIQYPIPMNSGTVRIRKPISFKRRNIAQRLTCPRSRRHRAAVRTVENPFSCLRRPRRPSLSPRRHPAGIVESFANSIRLLIVSMLDRTPVSSPRIERNFSSHPTTKTSIRTAIKRTKSPSSSISKPMPSCASHQHVSPTVRATSP